MLLLLFSCKVMSDSLWSHGLKHARLLYPPPSPRLCSNSCSLSQWCYLTISSSVTPFSFCLQSFPASVQFSCSVESNSSWPHGPASLSITNSRSWLKLISIESVMPSNQFILCCPLLLPPLILPSIRVFSNESVLHNGWPKYWSFSFNMIPSNEHPGLISFRMDWLDPLAVQGTLKSLLQHHSSKTSILYCSAFFIVQSHIHTWPLEKP